MRTVFKSIYAVFGAGAIAFGVMIFISPATLGAEVKSSFELYHVLREEAAAGIFIGLMFLWCIFNYERRAWVHYCLMVFAFLMAVIHWSDYLTGHRRWLSPVINSVPLLVLSIMILLDRPSKAYAHH